MYGRGKKLSKSKTQNKKQKTKEKEENTDGTDGIIRNSWTIYDTKEEKMKGKKEKKKGRKKEINYRLIKDRATRDIRILFE